MRALLVAAVLAGATLARSATALAADETMRLAPKIGESITQTELLGYLFVAPQSGDWLRFRISVDGSPLLVKTVGFGSELLHDEQRAYFETLTQTSGLVSQPVEAHSVAGGTVAWKMYVDAENFNDASRLYTFVAGIIRIGDALFRLGTAPGQPLAAPYHQTLESLVLYGTLPLPDNRSGLVSSSRPQDLQIDGKTVHTVHTTVDFAAAEIGMATGLPQARVEAWQTTDVPLGVVALRSTTNGHVYSVDLTAFGRGSYRSVITQQFDDIQNFPG